MLGKMSKAVVAVLSMAVVLGLLAGCAGGGGDFTISVAPVTASIAAGKSGTVTVNVARTDGFKGEVTFALTEAPTGVRGRFTPMKITGTDTQSTLALTVNSKVAVGDYPLKVTATSGKLKKEANLTLSVLVVADFTLETAPTAVTVRQGTTSSPVRVDIKRTPTFTDAVTLTLEGAPAGVKATFDPVSTTDGQSALSLEVVDTAKPGNYTLTVRGKGGGLDRTVKLTLTVEEPFSISVEPRSVTVRQDATSSPIAVSLKRAAAFIDAVALTIENAPAGVTGSFSPPSATADKGTLTIRVAATVQAGEYPLTICGKAGGLDKTVKLTLTVVEPFNMSVEPRSVTVRQKAEISPITVSLKRAATFTDAVALTIEGAPAGVSGSFSPPSATSDAGTLTIQVAEDASPGTYSLQVAGTSGPFTQTVSLKLVVFTKESLNVAFSTQALEILPEWERIEQVRDWIVHAFLAAREVPADRIAVSLHSQPPLRQPALSEVHSWQYGIGRWVWVDDDPTDDSVGDLYAFLPAEADQQLLGELADDFRRTTGEVPAFVHHVAYKLDEHGQTASFAFLETLAGKEEVFADGGPFGYREREIRTRVDLKRFLREIDDLVYISVERGVLTLGGRDLPGRSPVVSVEDVAALYQAYVKADEVGFSLDPESPDVGDEDVAVLTLLLGLPEEYRPFVALWSELPDEVPTPSVTPSDWEEVGESVLSRNLLPLHQVMKKLLDEGTEEARKGYSEISSLLARYACQCARYDGDIQGTKVGMTLFYCDLLAKLWIWDFGGTTPREIGMVPELELPVTCTYWEEIWTYPKGRVWFGPDRSRVGESASSLLFSPVFARIFARADDPVRQREEVKPPESMRVFNEWWEAHWPEIMNYEPEYFRLNQIVKFSAVLAWLREDERLEVLGFLDREPVTRTYEFDTWLEENQGRLTFTAWLPFTETSPTGTECLSLLCSEPQTAFGMPTAFLRGGVTLTRREDLQEILKFSEYLRSLQEALLDGKGKVMAPNKTAYTFTAPTTVDAKPGSETRFRAPAVQFPQIQKIRCTWERLDPNTWRYSSAWTVAPGQVLDEQLTIRRTDEGIAIEEAGSALALQRLAAGLVGEMELPWEYMNEMYHEPETGNLFIETTYGWFQAAAPKALPPVILQAGSPVTSYIPAVQRLTTAPQVKEENKVNLADPRNRIDSWKKAEAGCLIVPLGNFYYVVTTRGPAFAYTFSADSELAKALTGEIPWPTSQLEVAWWWGFEEFVHHFFSKLPSAIKWEPKGTKIILYTPGGTRPVLDVPRDIKENIPNWLEVKPVESALEIEVLEEWRA